MGPSVDGSVRWWVGLMRSDTTYSKRIESKRLELKRKCEKWEEVAKSVKTIPLTELETEHQANGCVTIFLRMSEVQESFAEDLWKHGVPDMFERCDDSFREEENSSFKHVEWDAGYEPSPENWSMTSPVFKLLNQLAVFMLCCEDGIFKLLIFGINPSNGTLESVRISAGIKSGDGTYNHRIYAAKRDQSSDVAKEGAFLKMSREELVREHLSPDGIVTVFLRANFSPLEARNLDVIVVPTRSEGIIQIEEGDSFNHVEWKVEYPQEYRSVTSSKFGVRSQVYRLELSVEPEGISLHLYRNGPSCTADFRTVRYWAGLRRSDGSYYHRNLRGELWLERECKIWTNLKLPHSYTAFEVERKLLTPGKTLAAFFRLTSGESSKAFNLGPIQPRDGDGCFREEEDTYRKEVEWSVIVEPKPEEGCILTSPEFLFGNQRYLLELAFESVTTRLNLFRFGPCANGRVRWWQGLKRTDGSYHHKIEAGYLEFEDEYEMWRHQLLLKTYKLSDMQHFVDDRKVTFFLRLSEAAPDMFIRGSIGMSTAGTGKIQEKECSTHEEVDWGLQDILQGYFRTLTSPEFGIGDQRYLLELSKIGTTLYVDLYRTGPSIDGPVWFWAGLKKTDGAYYHNTERGTFYLKENYELWSRVRSLYSISEADVERELFWPRHATFFLRLSMQEPSKEYKLCTHGSTGLSAEGAGTVREEECPSHKEVEWRIEDVPRRKLAAVSSPEFQIGDQRCLLELRKSRKRAFTMHLFRMGPFVDDAVRFWAGWKQAGGAKYRNIKRGTLEFNENCELWSRGECLYHMSNAEIQREHFSLHHGTFFLRYSLEGPPNGSEVCIHGSSDASTRGDGDIRLQECPSHTFVEWDIFCETKGRLWSLTSSSFTIGNQHYQLELRPSKSDTKLRLYRMGPCIDGPAGSSRWCGGLKCSDSAYNYRYPTGTLDLKEECDVWRKVKRLSLVRDSELKSGRLLTFFFCLSKQRSSSSLVECLHVSPMTSRPRAGSIVEEEWFSYKQVEWHFVCIQTSNGDWILTSPDFSINNQHFILDLVFDGFSWNLHLFRRGNPVDVGPARWFLGTKFCSDYEDHHQSECGQINLEETCDLWVQEERVHLCGKFESDTKKRVTVSFLMSLDGESRKTEVANNTAETLPDFQHLEKGDVVFKVQGKEFIEHRAVFGIRVPVLAAMFQYDTVEKRTGVVHIEDCDPSIFEIFLKYVGTGELPDLTSNEVFGLCAVADKYLMETLKYLCLRRIKVDLRSVDTFCDVVQLIIRYLTEDLLETASEFLSENESIIHSAAWKNLKREYPEIASNLETVALRREN